MLIGRESEQARIRALLDAAQAGHSGALVLRGEAGIGKTALLDAAAGNDDFQILRAQGVESEAEIAFSGLHDLLGPIVGLRSSLPRPQADALAVALSLHDGEPAERLAISAGVLGLLAVASAHRPVLAIIDDAHLVDRASADALGFAARRLRDERVAMLFSIREGDPSSFTTDGLEDLFLDSLDEGASARLLEQSDRDLSAESRGRVLALAQGNPLAILELPEWIELGADDGSRGRSVRPGGLLSRAFGRRVERLPAETRTALTIAAANDDGDLPTILRACQRVGVAPGALTPAETIGVISLGTDRLTFRHPLVRAVVYADATAAERRDAHRALSEALLDHRTEGRWAWHRALAAVGPDEVAAAALEAAAATSKNTSASARALERAARLSGDAATRTRRLIAAALEAEAAGQHRSAEAMAEEAGRASIDPIQRAALDHLLGRIWTLDGDVGRAVEVLTTGARAVASLDPDRAAWMLADAADAAIDDLPRASSLADEAVAIPHADRASEQVVMLRVGDVLGWKGDASEASAAWLRSAALVDPADAWSLRLGAEALFSAGLDDEATSLARAAVDLARARGQLTALAQSLDFIALVEARRGRLLDALDVATEALDLVSALGQAREELSISGSVAWVEGLLGQELGCRAHVARAAELSVRTGHPAPRRPGLGVLELALGRPDVAVKRLLADAPDAERLGADAIAPCSFVPSLVEAMVWSGRAADAAPIARAYLTVAERSGLSRAQALAHRCRGLAEGSIDHLHTALDMQREMSNPYEAARTGLCLGRMLRRRGKRLEARAILRSALEGFDATGARTWAERARSELETTGLTTRPRAPTASDELTPQERNVARLVASGLTNREISERLFVTTNTVETHLRHIFQKLDVTSRTQLAIAIGERMA